MLKKASSFVLASLGGSTYGKMYASPPYSLRPRWPAFLNILVMPPCSPRHVCVVGVIAALWLVQPDGAAERFTLVLDGAGVQDAKTGLIWEQSPDLEHDVWSRSVARCATKTLGGKTGWRAPTVDELKSLADPEQHDPALPEGHPFSNIKSSIFWSATPSPKDDIVAWQMSFFSGEAVTDQKSGTRRMWCVLGEPRK